MRSNGSENSPKRRLGWKDEDVLQQLMLSVSIGDFSGIYELDHETEDEFTPYRVLIKLMLDTIQDKLSMLDNTQKTLEIQNSNLNQQLERSVMMLERLKDFNMLLSHDVRSPVAAAISLLDIMIHRKEVDVLKIAPKIQQQLFQIHSQLEDLDESLNKLLNSTEDVSHVSLRAAFESALKFVEHTLPYHNYRISLDFEEPDDIYYSEIELVSLFQNLLSNAIKYRNLDGKLEIKVQSKQLEQHAEIRFTDNGIGIDLNAHRDKLFERGQRFTDQATGSGIGLYMIKKQLSQRGGSIQVESKPGAGSTFIVKLKKQEKL